MCVRSCARVIIVGGEKGKVCGPMPFFELGAKKLKCPFLLLGLFLHLLLLPVLLLLLQVPPGVPGALQEFPQLAVDGVVLLLDRVQGRVERVQLGVEGGKVWKTNDICIYRGQFLKTQLHC